VPVNVKMQINPFVEPGWIIPSKLTASEIADKLSDPSLNVDFKTKRDLKELDEFLINFITNRPKMTTPMD
jgi:hypothetical protein